MYPCNLCILVTCVSLHCVSLTDSKPVAHCTPLELALSGLLSASAEEEASSLCVKVREDSQRGVFATVPLKKGQYTCEYAGEAISLEEAKKREEEYKSNEEGCYVLNVGNVAIDATRTYHRIGRFINHAKRNVNMKLFRPLTVKGDVRVAIMATRDVLPGEELFYDYGIRDVDLPWTDSDAKDQPGVKKGPNRIRRACPVLGCGAHVKKLSQHLKTCHPNLTGIWLIVVYGKYSFGTWCRSVHDLACVHD